MHQEAPDPVALADLITRLEYRPNWTCQLVDEPIGADGSGGLRLYICARGYDSYHVDRGQTYGVIHSFIVPAATYNEQNWRHWLFERFLDVERHEASEFFSIDGVRPYAPHHGPGHDPYFVFERGTDVDARTRPSGQIVD